MAPRPHLQAAAIAAWWIHGPHDHGDGWQSQLCPYHRKWPKEQVTTPQERRPTGICHDAPTVQHLHLRPANHHLHKVCICWRPSNHACWWRLAGGGRGADQGHGNTRWIPPDLKLKFSTTKTVSVVFHLNKKEAISVSWKSTSTTKPCPSALSPNTSELDRSLTYRRHLGSLHKKLTSRVALLRRLAGSGCGAGATTLPTATLALVHLTAEYHCAPVWCRNAHTRLIDPTINDALRIVTGCLRSTPADNLPILAGIQPAELRRSGATLSLGRRAMELGHLLHSAFTRPSSAVARRLESRLR